MAITSVPKYFWSFRKTPFRKLCLFGKGKEKVLKKISPGRPLQVSKFSKNLSRAVGVMYKVDNLCKPPILRALYLCLFNSHLSHLWPRSFGEYQHR